MRILDTDHCVAILRGRLDISGRIPASETLAITTITIAELVHGVWRSARPVQNLSAVDVLFGAARILVFDESAARRFGKLKADLERSGNVVADLDLQIASIALQHNLPLMTHNQNHFQRIPGLEIDDWL